MGDDLFQLPLGGRLQNFLPTASKQLKQAGFSRKQRAQALRNTVANTLIDKDLEGATDLNKVRPAAVETAAAKVGAPKGKAARPTQNPHLRIEEPIQQPPLPPA